MIFNRKVSAVNVNSFNLSTGGIKKYAKVEGVTVKKTRYNFT
jgi:hypothetical protein